MTRTRSIALLVVSICMACSRRNAEEERRLAYQKAEAEKDRLKWEAEKQRLDDEAEARAKKIEAAKAAAASVKVPPIPRERDAFAADYELQLFKRKMNPDGVSAMGPEKKTLQVKGWFCSKQFIFDFTTGTIGTEARALGFTRVECSSASQTAWSEL